MSKIKARYHDFICSDYYEDFNLNPNQIQNSKMQSKPHPEYLKYLKANIASKLKLHYNQKKEQSYVESK